MFASTKLLSVCHPLGNLRCFSQTLVLFMSLNAFPLSVSLKLPFPSLFLFFCTFLMSSVCLPFRTVFAFSPAAAMESSILWHLQGYVLFVTGGIWVLSRVLLSVNHYIFVVKSTHYDRVYTIRNIRVDKVYFCDRARYTCYPDVCVLNKRVVVTWCYSSN